MWFSTRAYPKNKTNLRNTGENNMKYYDKNIYKLEKKIKTELIILTVFIISFSLGFFIGKNEENHSIQKLNNERYYKVRKEFKEYAK